MSDSPRFRLTVEHVLQHSDWVRGLARQLLSSRDSADDVVQDAWLAALDRPPEIRTSFGGWLRQVVQHAAIRREQSDAARRRREVATARAGQAPAAADVVARAQGQRIVAGFVLELPEPYRSTLLLRYFEGRSFAEIARESGVPASTVRVHHQRALRELRERLVSKRGGDPDAWRAVAAFFSAAGVATHGATLGAIGALIMTTKAKAASAAVIVLLLGGAAWWQMRDRGATSNGAFSVAPAPAAGEPITTPPAERPSEPPAVASAPALVASKLTKIRVTDEGGAPISPAVIVAADRPLRSLAEPGCQVVGISDASGILFRDLSEVPPALGSISAHHPAFITAVVDRPVEGADLAITMRAGEAVTFECRALGRPVPGVVIRISRSGLEPRPLESWRPPPSGIAALAGTAGRRTVFEAASDETGRAVMTGLPRGKYGVNVECPNHAAKLASQIIDVPASGPIVIELVEVWVWALDVDVGAPDVLATKHPGRPASVHFAYQHELLDRWRREWPGRFFDLIAFQYPGGAAPPDLKIGILRASGASETSVRAVRLVDFVRPQPEGPITPGQSTVHSAEVTIRFVNPDGAMVEGFRDYTVTDTGFSPFRKGDWISSHDSKKDRNRYREGRYRISATPPASAFDLDPVEFVVDKRQQDLEVVVRLKRASRVVRIDLTCGPFGDVVGGMVNATGGDGTKAVFYNRRGWKPRLPVGVPLRLEISAFGCLKRTLTATIPPGDGEHVLTIALEDEPDAQ